MTVAIAIRDETSEALQALMKKAKVSQEGVSPDLSISDVIDTLLDIVLNTDCLEEVEVLEAIVITAERD